jgi:hypothetical protein
VEEEMNWTLIIIAYLLAGPAALLAHYLLRRIKMALVRQYQKGKGWGFNYDQWDIWPPPVQVNFNIGFRACLFGPLSLIVFISDGLAEIRYALQHVAKNPRFVATTDALQMRHTLAEVEAMSAVPEPTISDCTVPAIAFGHMHFGWEHFKTQLVDGDEIWSFEAGNCQGYAALRHGLIVQDFTYAGD